MTPESVEIEADEVYFDALENAGDSRRKDLEGRASLDRSSRHAAYAKVWQAAREPLNLLLAAARELLAECAEVDGLESDHRREIRRLVAAMDEAEVPSL